MRGSEGFSISVQTSVLYIAPILLLLLPLRWLMAALLAACIHEAWHILAIRLMGGRILEIRIGATGAVIETEPLSPTGELLAALAGPTGSLSLLLLAKWIPCTALCALVHALYNLLPLYPLDGGRVLHCLLSKLFSPRLARKAANVIEGGTVVLLGVLLAVLRINLLFFLIVLLPSVLRFTEKYLAKRAN